jgi:hypothetical protein
MNTCFAFDVWTLDICVVNVVIYEPADVLPSRYGRLVDSDLRG